MDILSREGFVYRYITSISNQKGFQMKILKAIVFFIRTFLGIIIIGTIITIATMFTYFPLQQFLFGRGEYLLFVTSKINMISVIMIMVLMIYLLLHLYNKIENKKEQFDEEAGIEELYEMPIETEENNRINTFLIKLSNKLSVHENKLSIFENKVKRIFRVIRKCYIPALIIAIFCGMTSYSILYEDSIKISSPINPAGSTYSYSEIKSIDVGILGYEDLCTPYYVITLKNNKTVDLFGGSPSHSSNLSPEEILAELDSSLRKQGIAKKVDKSNFEKFAEGLDENYVKEVEKLLEQ